MVNTRSEYEPDAIQAAKRVLLEIASVFEDDLDHIVFVGGTACSLLFSQDTEPHEGTIDVDMAIDPAALSDYTDDTLEEKLIYANYQQVEGKKFRWDRRVRIDGRVISVMVEFLSGEYDGARRYSEARAVQGIYASVLRGMDIAFIDPRDITISGLLPNGVMHEAAIKVCSPASLLAMKGISIHERIKGADKDAVDIDYILRRYPDGLETLSRVFRSDAYVLDSLVQEGIRGIAKAFETLESIGPASVASIDRYTDAEERAIIQQSAFQRAQRFLRLLKI